MASFYSTVAKLSLTMLIFCNIVFGAPVENATTSSISEYNITGLTSATNPLSSSTESEFTTTALKTESTSNNINEVSTLSTLMTTIQGNDTTLSIETNQSTSADSIVNTTLSTPYRRGNERNNLSTTESTETTTETTPFDKKDKLEFMLSFFLCFIGIPMLIILTAILLRIWFRKRK